MLQQLGKYHMSQLNDIEVNARKAREALHTIAAAEGLSSRSSTDMHTSLDQSIASIEAPSAYSTGDFSAIYGRGCVDPRTQSTMSDLMGDIFCDVNEEDSDQEPALPTTRQIFAVSAESYTAEFEGIPVTPLVAERHATWSCASPQSQSQAATHAPSRICLESDSMWRSGTNGDHPRRGLADILKMHAPPEPTAAVSYNSSDGKQSVQERSRAHSVHMAQTVATRARDVRMLDAALPIGLVSSTITPDLRVSSPPGLFQSQHCEGEAGPIDGSDITALIIRNIPARCTQEQLLEYWPPLGSYDLLYLPFNHRLYRTVGYVFVNFVSHAALVDFRDKWDGIALMPDANAKRLNMSAAEVQGFEANLINFSLNKNICRIKRERHMPVIIGPDGAFGDFKRLMNMIQSCQQCGDIAR